MELFKINNFCADHPSQHFPEYRLLSNSEREIQISTIRDIVGVRQECSNFALCVSLKSAGVPVLGVNVMNPGFDFVRVFAMLTKQLPKVVYLNWHWFEEIDEMEFGPFIEHFLYIWYPGVDDVDIWAPGQEWVVSVDHGGNITVVSK